VSKTVMQASSLQSKTLTQWRAIYYVSL